MWLVSVSTEAGGGGGAAEPGVSAAAESGPDWWTLGAGVLGGLIVAITNHFFSRRRDSGSWLRHEQVAANRNFHTAALALAHFATHGLTGRPRSEAAAEVHVMDRELMAKWQELLVIGESNTVNTAQVVSDLLPNLAYQSIPLPRTGHPAAVAQRSDALGAIAEMMFALEMSMREGVGLGLLNQSSRTELRRSRASQSFEQQALSPVDREGPKPDLFELLRDWEVLAMAGERMPEKISDYCNGTHMDELPSGGHLLAILRKPPDAFWLFGICAGVPSEVESKILQDVARIVTGHIKAFKPIHLHNHTSPGDDEAFPGDTFTWSSHEFPNFDFTALNTSDE